MLSLNEAWAHSRNRWGVPQMFLAHVRGVAKRARDYASKFGAGDLGELAGLLHDLGKLLDEWQAYVRGYASEEKLDHRAAGAVMAFLEKHPELAFVIHGHHGGLPSKGELMEWLRAHQDRPVLRFLIDRARESMPELAAIANPQLPPFLKSSLSWEFFIRMLFSALVDADWLDTESHFSPRKARIRKQSERQHELHVLYTKLFARVESMPLDGPVNQYRRKVFDACLKAASLPQGFYRLTVPTGGGKTYSSMAFALGHALYHRLDRVIVAIPYTSITEQSADVYRSVFGPDQVLEHHSAIGDDAVQRTDYTPTWTKLASENWDSRIVVTTTVQLFESAMSNKPSRCRKLHNYANSVIILDEVQTLPVELLEPILDILKELVANYRVTVVLCTATQPALDQSPYLNGLPNVREIVPNSRELYDVLKRVEYRIIPPREKWSWAKVAAVMQETPQCMTVVNTIGDSLALLRVMKDDPAVLYLSTNLCGAHRRQVLAEVRRRLQAGEPVRLITTQVVEAGVDLDFPRVLRAIGPLDRIVQAAGRANREGKLTDEHGNPKLGEVIIFTPESGKLPPGPYLFATYLTGKFLSDPNVDLHDPDLYTRYFRELYRRLQKDLDKYQIQEARKQFNYPEVASLFRMIREDTIPAVVHYRPPGADSPDPAADLIEELLRSQPSGTTWRVMRRLQPYLVQFRTKDLLQYSLEGKVREIIPGLYEWLGEYDPLYGVRSKHLDDVLF